MIPVWRAFVLAAVLASATQLTACGWFGPSNNTIAAADVPPPEPGKLPDDYVIGAGDSLSIFVYRSPELSEGGVSVRPDGRISIPLIEDHFVAGKTPTQLARELEERLKKYIQDPIVTVIVRGFVGPTNRQIRVIGEASEPLAIPYREHMTLLDVMIATKGVTKFAAANRAIVVRTDQTGKSVNIRVRLNDLIKEGDVTQNIEMAPGDTLIIPQSWF